MRGAKGDFPTGIRIMLKRKPRRSREFKKNSQVIDMTEAREDRRSRRQEAYKAAKKEEKKKKEASARQKVKKNRRRLIYAAIILIIIAVIGASAFNVILLIQEKTEMADRQQELLAEKERLEEKLAGINDLRYIEQQARDHLRLIKPGEILYILPQTQNAEEDGVQEE